MIQTTIISPRLQDMLVTLFARTNSGPYMRNDIVRRMGNGKPLTPHNLDTWKNIMDESSRTAPGLNRFFNEHVGRNLDAGVLLNCPIGEHTLERCLRESGVDAVMDGSHDVFKSLSEGSGKLLVRIAQRRPHIVPQLIAWHERERNIMLESVMRLLYPLEKREVFTWHRLMGKTPGYMNPLTTYLTLQSTVRLIERDPDVARGMMFRKKFHFIRWRMLPNSICRKLTDSWQDLGEGYEGFGRAMSRQTVDVMSERALISARYLRNDAVAFGISRDSYPLRHEVLQLMTGFKYIAIAAQLGIPSVYHFYYRGGEYDQRCAEILGDTARQMGVRLRLINIYCNIPQLRSTSDGRPTLWYDSHADGQSVRPSLSTPTNALRVVRTHRYRNRPREGGGSSSPPSS